jgi:hypothetical protein
MPSAESEPAIPATKRSQTYALYRAATGIGTSETSFLNVIMVSVPDAFCEEWREVLLDHDRIVGHYNCGMWLLH